MQVQALEQTLFKKSFITSTTGVEKARKRISRHGRQFARRKAAAAAVLSLLHAYQMEKMLGEMELGCAI